MNRRGFLSRVCRGIVGAAAIAHVPASWVPKPIRDRVIYFKNIPLVYDQHCPSNTVYFAYRSDVARLHVWDTRSVRRL